jgi:hypothetical protein
MKHEIGVEKQPYMAEPADRRNRAIGPGYRSPAVTVYACGATTGSVDEGSL